MKNIKKNFFGYAAIALALVMVTVTAFAFVEPGNTAEAEAVTISENATIVTSPFTAAVQQVRSKVVGVNNYTEQMTGGSNYYNPFGSFAFCFAHRLQFGK